MKRWLLVGGVFFAVAIMGGCATKPEATAVEAHLRAAVSMNPDDDDRPSPMVIRYYELAASGVFESADFFALYNNDRSLLGDALLAREEMELAPTEQRVLRRTVAPGTRYVGFIAAYRDLANARWRVVHRLSPNELNAFEVRLGERAIDLDGL